MMCPFLSSTRNIVFGRASFTRPSTSIASSFATIPPILCATNSQKKIKKVQKKLDCFGDMLVSYIKRLLSRFGEKKLKQSFINKMKESLIGQRNQILEALASRNVEFKELVSKVESGDEIDVASDAVDRNMIDSLGVQDANRLQLINNALTRIQQGKYGLCLACGKQIPESRLEALPYAFMCIDCQTKAEKKKR